MVMESWKQWPLLSESPTAPKLPSFTLILPGLETAAPTASKKWRPGSMKCLPDGLRTSKKAEMAPHFSSIYRPGSLINNASKSRHLWI
jgi:hypothetical protein